jgi:hypothetical protein
MTLLALWKVSCYQNASNVVKIGMQALLWDHDGFIKETGRDIKLSTQIPLIFSLGTPKRFGDKRNPLTQFFQ